MTTTDYICSVCVVTFIACWVVFLILRALICGRVLSAPQFEEFQEHGISKIWSFLPPRIHWEYKFLCQILKSSTDSSAKRLLRIWKLNAGLAILSIITLIIVLAMDIFQNLSI